MPGNLRQLRRASFITPNGERSKRVFTLREASHRPSRDDERTPLLSHATHEQSYIDRIGHSLREYWEFWTSQTGINVLKASIAYALGSLVTFVPFLYNVLYYTGGSRHMVATVVVWFHPARTVGSMHEAFFVAMLALLYSLVIGLTSMFVAIVSAAKDMLFFGHMIILLLFLGGGLGVIGWVKQRLGHPLVNMACSLASIGCITILVKEGAVSRGYFSEDRVVQIILMVLAGILITTAVNMLVLPTTARLSLVKELEKNTDLLGEMLISVTRAFLSGRESDLTGEDYKKLADEHRTSLSSMHKDIGEAKRELYALGRVKQYETYARTVDCLAGLSQDLGGLRSAAFAQFAFINHVSSDDGASSGTTTPQAPQTPIRETQHPNILGVIREQPEEANTPNTFRTANGSPTVGSGFSTPERGYSFPNTLPNTPGAIEAPGDMFVAFVAQLGPPTKSLVFTLKKILDELPFKHKDADLVKSYFGMTNVDVAVNENFRNSLRTAIDLYRHSRNEALQKLYANRAINAAGLANNHGVARAVQAFTSRTKITPQSLAEGQHKKSVEVLADIEEVSACCGHFSFSLLDFAEAILTYLDALEDLKLEMDRPTRSWKWVVNSVAPRWMRSHEEPKEPQVRRPSVFQGQADDDGLDARNTIPEDLRLSEDFADPKRPAKERPWAWRLHKFLLLFKRDDTKYAIKVGVGAIVLAIPAFTVEFRELFLHWKMEWGLVSYMAVCSMTVGASWVTTVNRPIGTFFGACLAVLAWLLASAPSRDPNPWILGILGWMVSVGCFYLIIAKGNGPMGRFVLLTYSLAALSSYTDVSRDPPSSYRINPKAFDVAMHRFISVVIGCLWAMIVMYVLWPISARRKLREGFCVLWLRMSLIWKRDPLAMFLLGEPVSKYMDIREESTLQTLVVNLDGLMKAAKTEYELRGPFHEDIYNRILDRTRRMVDSFHALNVVISKNFQYTPGEAAVLLYTRRERFQLSARISSIFYSLASSMKLEYPVDDSLPNIEHTRDRLLARISQFRREGDTHKVTEQDYEMLYAYVLVTGQLEEDIQAVREDLASLFGVLNEESLKLD